MVAGLAFLVLVWSARHPQGNGLTAFWWFVLAYFVLEVGEMLLSPIGLAAVTELSVRSVVGVMMGAWWLGTAYSEVLAALLGKLRSEEHTSELQSLMRISYAVFCLKKTKHNNQSM